MSIESWVHFATRVGFVVAAIWIIGRAAYYHTKVEVAHYQATRTLWLSALTAGAWGTFHLVRILQGAGFTVTADTPTVWLSRSAQLATFVAAFAIQQFAIDTTVRLPKMVREEPDDG